MANQTPINRSKLMQRARAIYHTCRYDHERKAIASRFIRNRFANALRSAWAEVKRTATQIEQRIAELHREIDFTKYLPIGVNQMQRVQALEKQISVLRRAA